LRAGLVGPRLAAVRAAARDLAITVRPHELEAAVAHAARWLGQLGHVGATVMGRPRTQLAVALPRPGVGAAVDLAGDLDRLEMGGPLEARLAQLLGRAVVDLALASALASAAFVRAVGVGVRGFVFVSLVFVSLGFVVSLGFNRVVVVRLDLVRLGCVRFALVGLGFMRLALVRLALVRLALVRLAVA